MTLPSRVRDGFLDHLIMRAESMLGDLRSAGFSGAPLYFVETIMAQMHDERRRRHEAMMLHPFRAPHEE